MVTKEYGEVMRFLLHFREQYETEEEYRQFLLRAVRELVRDLRDFDVLISLQPEILRPSRPVARAS
ncbi:MAG: hypothetical protein D6723_07070 [Acidobacteria bacterium]|nr:MAG: hypothetical protein D6723_07070 [Acidobacteriota bacterium]